MKKFEYKASDWNSSSLSKIFIGVNTLFNVKVVKCEWKKIYRLQADVNLKGRGSLVSKCVTLGEFDESQKSELMEKLNILLTFATTSKKFKFDKVVKNQSVSYWYNINL